MSIMRLVFWSVGLSFLISISSADEGKIAPPLTAKLLNGESFSLSASTGKVVILHFWATWCAPCMKEMPAFEVYYKKHHREGLEIVAISMDKPADEAKARTMAKDFSFLAAFGKDTSFKGYGRIWKMPLTFVIDRKGILRKEDWDGENGIDAALLDQTVTPLLKAAP